MLAESKIVSETDLQRAISHHAEVRLRKDFDVLYSDAVRCVHGQPDSGHEGESLVRKLEQLELRRMYESVHGGPPAVRIESMEDLRQLADGRRSLSPKRLRLCEKYFELKDICSTNQMELVRVHQVPERELAKWSVGIEPVPIRDVRRAEEHRIISEWAARTDSRSVYDRIKEDSETDSLRAPIRRLPVLSRPDVEDLCSAHSPKSFSTEDAASVVRAIGGRMEDTSSRVLCADLGDESIPAESALGAFRTVLRRDSELVEKSLEGPPLSDGSVPHTRLAIVDGKLYIWTPDTDPMSLVNAYSELHFYFRDNNAFARLMEDIKTTMDGNRMGGLSNTVEFSEKLVREMFGDRLLSDHAKRFDVRVRGDHLHLLLDLLDRPLESLEGDISRVTRYSGIGGITNPKFPRGEKLENAIAGLAGTVITDCHLKEKGTISLNESEIKRIEIIEKSLRAFGDINLNAKWIPVDNSYEVNFPSVLGRMLLHLGVPSGDRTVQNPGLPEVVFGFSWRARCVLVENIVPQDGTVSDRAISWTHSNVLDPGEKGERYSVWPVVNDGDIAFIKKHGDEYQEYWVLNISGLEKRKKSLKHDDAIAASSLLDKIDHNPNRLIKDGKKLTDSIGVEMVTVPRTVHYFKKTGRVTVSWEIHTANVQEAVKLATIAPPDDVKKKQAVKSLLIRRPEDVKHALDYFAARGINIQPWWSDK